MWKSLIDKLQQIKAMDTQLAAFGAKSHRYSLRTPLKPKDLDAIEKKLGGPLPDELRSFYLEVGDGGAGPHYGLRSAEKLSGYRPAERFRNANAIKKIAAESGELNDESGYYDAPKDELTGLVTIIDEGCGHEICLVTNGPTTGRVFYVPEYGPVHESTWTLHHLYQEWLDHEIELFAAVHDLMRARLNREEIYDEMKRRFEDYSSDDRIASIANAPKPPELFGEGVYHGAVQFPWYDKVLKDWQASHVR